MEHISGEIINVIKTAAKQATQNMLDDMGVDNVLDKLYTFPADIYRQNNLLVSAKRGVEEAKGGLELAKQVVVAGVLAEIDANGKPRYSNEKAREAEITKRLAQDPEYQKALRDYRAAEDACNGVQFELDRLHNEFSAYKAASRIMAGKLNMVAGL